MNSPAAIPENSIVHHQARFTVLKSRLLRLEWAEDGQFEDLATLTVCNRATAPVEVSVEQSGNDLTLRTADLTLSYTPDGKPFSKSNLRIRFRLNGKTVAWWPGKRNRGDLKGTARTLDGVNGSKIKKWVPAEQRDPDKDVRLKSKDGSLIWQGDMKELPLCGGLISRDGWAVVDDSASVVLDPDLCDWQPWVRERHAGKRQDLYFLGYGHAYTDALGEAQEIFGAQPLPPRYALGYWYSRYWAYTDKELKELVQEFDAMGLPLDVLVIDMDWHKMGWTGYSWDPDYFPDPEGFLKWLKSRDLKITLNLHPADGVFDFEDAFPCMLKEMGLRKTDVPDLEPLYHRLYELLGLETDGAKRIPLDICDPAYMRAYFKCLHRPMEKMGVDFWWMDWQQGNQGSQLPNLDTLPWINELHWQDQANRRGRKRPLNFSRFGGVGAGRMPVGFSGDTHVTWESLAYQPYFTATASNVLYGTWSHDIGGHMQGTLTPELYTRWIQFGIHSPVFRTHTSKDPASDRRVFHFPDPYRSVMMKECRRRYELIPYIYGALRTAVETGVSLTRPMYYSWPEEDAAYRARNQVMFGEGMLVAPVIRPLDEKDRMAPCRVWLPEGTWWDCAWGQPVEGGKTLTRRYTLEETPVFVRPGTVIPEQEVTTRVRKGSYTHPVFRIYPGKKGEGVLYEDDGVTTDWQEGASVRIRLSHSLKGSVRTVTLHPAEGSFKGFKAKRKVTLLLEGFAPPRGVSHGEVTYDGDTATLRIELGRVDLSGKTVVTIREAGPSVQKRVHGMKGIMTRLEKIRALNCLISPVKPQHADERLAVRAAQTGNRISINPDMFTREMRQLRDILKRLPASQKEYRNAMSSQDPDHPSMQEITLQQASGILTTTVRQFSE